MIQIGKVAHGWIEFAHRFLPCRCVLFGEQHCHVLRDTTCLDVIQCAEPAPICIRPSVVRVGSAM